MLNFPSGDGDFASRMPVVTDHETSGIVVKIGASVKGFRIDDKVTADSSELYDYCQLCRQGELLLCENFEAHGVHRTSKCLRLTCLQI